jgi:Tfp pilus assembly protein PilN
LIEVNLNPSGKRRASQGGGWSPRLPSFEGFAFDRWVLGASLILIGAVGGAGYLYWTTNERKGDLEVEIQALEAQAANYADQITKNDSLFELRNSLDQRVGIILEIDEHRYVWAHILDEVARALPEYTWLTEIVEVSLGDQLQFRLEGRSGNIFALTNFMENLEASFFIRDVRLIAAEQVVESVGLTNRALSRFTLEANFERPPFEVLETVPLFDTSPAGSDTLPVGG